MAVQNDPDLDSLFREELAERASSLSEGAQAVVDGVQLTVVVNTGLLGVGPVLL
jgi:hypothetical protein